ncbi:MAG: rubrerythrin-like domain-containing protein [Natronomonas sp.]|nr:rubrerythrin-like domain-containing protein [Natronomonas sp.]MDR9380296.1 rubrerythrin-like domain-containing protein [Natronomonas sp.]MDR9431003.1 rubrerythrin-like domain-containing protein [Natronomonas sp.]
MRPSDVQATIKLYECFKCGARVEDAAPGRCEECGGELLHLGRSRDL